MPHAVYEFGGFCLDPHERVLSRNSVPVPLTPKATDILLVLIARRGRIVDKTELMQQVWPDTAVDESNLTQNIYTLRRVLGNDDGKSQFIETVPRRGYRFVATVRELAVTPQDLSVAAPSPDAALGHDATRYDEVGVPSPPATIGRGGRRWIAALSALGGLALLAAAIGNDRFRSANSASNPGIVRFTHDGSVRLAAVSQDGRQVAYVRREGVRESLWLKSNANADPNRLLEPVDGTFRSLAFTPGEFLHYTLFRPNRTLVASFRISTHGGPPETMREPAGRVSFNPDGSRFAYVSTYSLTLRESRLVVSDAAGRDMRVITVRRPPESFVYTRPAWSPDGSRLLAFGTSELAPTSPELLIIDATAGRVLKARRLDLVTVDDAVWLPGAQDVVVSGRQQRGLPQRLWMFSLASETLTPLTSDLSDYALVGLSSADVVGVRGEVARTLWTAEVNSSDAPRQVAHNSGDLGDLEGLAWASNERILYTAAESGNVDVWSAGLNGDTRRRLTSDPADDFHPSATADGRTVVFASTRGGSAGIWTMEGDGRNAQRLTSGADVRPSISRDGQMLVFQRGGVDTTPFTLWRLRIGEREPALIADHHSMRPALSPDGRSIAHYLMTAEAWMLAITPSVGGSPMRTLPISGSHTARVVRWSPDGHAVAFIDGAGGASNIWVQALDGSPARKLTNFSEGRITTFDWSPDGTRLAWTRVDELRDVVTLKLTNDRSR